MALEHLNRSALSTVASLVISAALCAAAVASPLYRVTDLGFNAVAINNQGWIVGNDATGAVLWTGESVLTPISLGTARDINNFGRVVGSRGSIGWIWDPVFGLIEPNNLTNPAVINDLGQVAGPPPTPLNDAYGGYFWDPTFGFTTILNPGPPDQYPQGGIADVRPRGINNLGEVVGYAVYGEPTAFIWKPGFERAEFLPQTVSSEPPFGIANAVNEHGVIAGETVCTFPTSDLEHCALAIVWTDLEAQVIALGAASGINDSGWVVGGQQFSGFGFGFLWSEDFGLLNLNDLISPTDPLYGHLTLTAGNAINNNGWIIANGHYLLTPIPEPSVIALLGLGLAGLAFTRRRKL